MPVEATIAALRNPATVAAPPDYVPRQENLEDTRLRAVLRHLDMFEDIEISPVEMRRANAMIAAHGTNSLEMLRTIVTLRDPTQFYVDGSRRRVVLAALLGIAVGFEPVSAQSLIDKARNKELGDVAKFVAGEALAVACATSAGYGAYLVTGKAVAGATVKAAAVKSGAVGVGKGLLLVTGWVGLAIGAVVVGAAGVVAGARKGIEVADDNLEIMELKYFKDQRIWEGLKQGRLTIPNRIPRDGRAV